MLSSGQLQVMMLINCFVNEKELLLLDEPFQFLSLENKIRLQTYIDEHLPPWKTLILVTHYEEDISRWTNQVKQL